MIQRQSSLKWTEAQWKTVPWSDCCWTPWWGGSLSALSTCISDGPVERKGSISAEGMQRSHPNHVFSHIQHLLEQHGFIEEESRSWTGLPELHLPSPKAPETTTSGAQRTNAAVSYRRTSAPTQPGDSGYILWSPVISSTWMQPHKDWSPAHNQSEGRGSGRPPVILQRDVPWCTELLIHVPGSSIMIGWAAVLLLLDYYDQ